MKLASWIVTSHHRPALLAATLAHLRDGPGLGHLPYGWQMEIVVAHFASDRESADVAHKAGCVVVPTTEPYPSGKRNAALRECLGELVMTTDDDDFQSPLRLSMAIAAHQNGHQLSGIREFRRLHLATGNVVRWLGRGQAFQYRSDLPDLPPVTCGTARNYAREVLFRHHWDPRLSQMEDHDLHRRITKRRGGAAGIVEYDMGDVLATTTIIIQHDHNIFTRPDVVKGKWIRHGDYILVGEGHWTEVADFPRSVADRLTAVGW